MERNLVRKFDESYTVFYGSRKIDFNVIRRERSTLEIAVLPDTRVEVTAPQNSSSDAIVEKVTKRSRWILKQQNYFSQFIPKTTEKYYLGGETHLYLGRRYRLKIYQSDAAAVKLTRGYFEVYLPDINDTSMIRTVMDVWYRKQAMKLFDEIAALQSSKIGSISIAGIHIRSMKTRWGSLSQRGTLTLNENLIKTPRECIEYVITHELCHTRHHDHGTAFYTLLTKKMPDWQKRKQRLEAAL